MNYAEWNTAIGRHFFSPERADEPVYLSVDGETLRLAAERADPPVIFEDAHAAEKDFLVWIRWKLGRNGWGIGRLARDVYPLGLALAAFQVLAAHHMQDAGDWTEKAYWPRVREMLGESEISQMPEGLDREAHQALWRRGLALWANEKPYQNGSWGRLLLPEDEPGLRHVRIPLSQALIRQADLERLPSFFREVNFQPGEALDFESVWDEVEPRLYTSNFLTSHARRVLQNEMRRKAACEQIAAFLYAWDGAVPELSVRKQGDVLRLWAGLPSSSEPELVGGLLRRESTATDWTRVPVKSLADILGRREVCVDGMARYRPLRDALCYLLIYDQCFHYFIEGRAAAPGDRVIILSRHRSLAASLHTVAKKNAQLGVYGERHLPLRGLPKGWTLLKFDVSNDLPSELPPEWSRLIRPRGARIHPKGGLRLRRNVWLAGIGPNLIIDGNQPQSHAWINGERYPVEDGRIQQDVLDRPGSYQVWLPGQSRSKIRLLVRPGRRRRHLSEPDERWVFREGWPRWTRPEPETEARLYGPNLEGATRTVERSGEEALALRLALVACGHASFVASQGALENGSSHPNALIRALAAAARIRLVRPAEPSQDGFV